MTTNVNLLMHHFVRVRAAAKEAKADIISRIPDPDSFHPDYFTFPREFESLIIDFINYQNTLRKLAEAEDEMRSHPDFDADDLHEIGAEYYAYDPTANDRD